VLAEALHEIRETALQIQVIANAINPDLARFAKEIAASAAKAADEQIAAEREGSMLERFEQVSMNAQIARVGAAVRRLERYFSAWKLIVAGNPD